MCELQKDWDVNKAERISKDIISYVAGIVLRVSEQPEIYPTSEGGIQLQYEKEDKTYMELVFSNESITGMKINKGDYTTAEFKDFNYASVKEVVDYIGSFINE